MDMMDLNWTDMKNMDERWKSAMYPNCCSVRSQEWPKGWICTVLTSRFCMPLLVDG
jgi:hypothetical protein